MRPRFLRNEKKGTAQLQTNLTQLVENVISLPLAKYELNFEFADTVANK